MATKSNLVKDLYATLREAFGNGENEFFQMEMPARLLEMGNYHYDGSDKLNSQQLKPPSVAEAEFRLANGMLNLTSLVGGPNGSKMAESYEQVLFGLAPANANTSAELDKLVPDQQKIFEWLYEEVDNFDPPASDLLSLLPEDKNLPPRPAPIVDKNKSPQVHKLRDPLQTPKIPRIDLYQKLLDVYESERFRWTDFKNSARPSDDADMSKWSAYDRLLTTYAPVIDAKLEGLWAVLLVRGQYHRVRKYISYLDIQTAGEALQRAKESLRASVARSIDDAEDIYPVVLTPNNWAKYLSTNFRPEDLLSNVENTLLRLHDAEKQRSLLSSRRNALELGKQNIKALEKAASDAGEALRTAETNMVKGYGEAAINLIKMYFDVKTKKAQDKVAAVKGLGDSSKQELTDALAKAEAGPLTDEQWNSLKDMQAKCLQNQANVASAEDAYSNAMLAASKARGEDPTNSLEVITEQIQSLSIDIEYYKKALEGAENPLGVPITKLNAAGNTEGQTQTPVDPAQKPNTAPVAPPSQDGAASVWQWFVFNSTTSTSESVKLSSSSVSHSDWSVGLWFGSGSGHSDKAESSSSSKATSSNTNIQIGFRAMKVVIDRPWFNAQLLGQTGEFFNFNSTKISSKKPSEVHKTLADGEPFDASDCMLPSWTTAFVVVKDVHIILSKTDSWSDSEISDMQKSSSEGGGFLCFQASKSSASSDHRDAFAMRHEDKNIDIRIPAPQILGWLTQLAPEDVSLKSYTPLSEKEFAKPMKEGEPDKPTPEPGN
ncbi:hypothetical protein QBC38DRAFT_492703 [Podospora fimiseda]|uniref:Uncharacterized protein n=1 Tax=Podospora fimiseda TaxID=252190 RepID=A0AAN6YL55_9PEZI|nr:hypothetical protein QBC38DRAFT_492703 [Podospora fimiseda]